MKTLRYIISAVALITTITAFAQQNESVVVEGTYRPEIEKVKKMALVPDETSQDFAVPDQQVEVKDINHKFPIDLETMSPVGYNDKNGKGKSDDVAQNFLLAAFGTRISPLFVYRHNSDLSKTIGLGVGVSHYSSWLKMKNYPNSSFMNNHFDIALTTNLDSYRLSNKIYYNNDMNHYYGIPLDSIAPEDDAEILCPKQVYNTIGFESKISSTTTRLGYFRHAFGLGYHYTFDKYGSREHNAYFNTDLAYVNNFWGKKENPQTIGARISLMYDNYGNRRKTPFPYVDYGDADSMTNRILFGFKPYFEIKADFCKVDIGLSLDVAHDTVTKVAVRPDINASLYLFNKSTEIYAAVDGGLSMRTYRDVIEENPFVNSMLPMRFTNTKFGFSAGVRASIVKKVDLHVGVRYRRVQDEAFYVLSVAHDESYSIGDTTALNPVYINKFSFLYDTINDLKIMADLRWRILDNLTLGGSFAYNYIGNGDKEWHSWYKPAFVASLKLGYSPIKQLDLGLSAALGAGRYAKVWDGELWQVYKMKPIIDINFTADYNINDKVTVFLNLDNIAHARYQLYYDYPVTGIQAFAGLKVKF